MGRIDVISGNLPVLRELRDRMTQHDLAERVGVSRRTIARLESGEVADPGVDLMQRIAAALGVSLTHLISSPLRPVILPIPTELCDRLADPEILDAITRELKR